MIPPSSALYLFWELVQDDLVLIVTNGQSLFILRQLDRSALAAFLGVAATT